MTHFAKYASVTPDTPLSRQPTLWRTCRVLANRKRLQILALLSRQPNQTVSTVARHMRLSLPAASQYLRALEARGLLTCRRVELRVEYRLSAATTENAAGEILTALRSVFRRKAQPTKALFKLATAFTHPRRIEVFRAIKNGADSFSKLQTATHISARALSRHLAKLEARGVLKSEMEVYAVTNPPHPFGCVLARLAGE
jgi:DNA-binding transcriptional ArsR family regulator